MEQILLIITKYFSEQTNLFDKYPCYDVIISYPYQINLMPSMWMMQKHIYKLYL